jgi:hypothetical protein
LSRAGIFLATTFIQGVSAMTGQRKSGWVKRSSPRTTVKVAMAGLLIAGLSACGGGGGGDSSDDVNLRAAYDRINRDCMTYSDIDRAVGRTADETPNAGRRRWVSGNENLTVLFTSLRSGTQVAGVAIWDIVPGGELEKAFGIECGDL